MENAGSGGKCGIWWNMRDLVENAGSKWKIQGSIFFVKIRTFVANMEGQNFVSRNLR